MVVSIENIEMGGRDSDEKKDKTNEKKKEIESKEQKIE